MSFRRTRVRFFGVLGARQVAAAGMVMALLLFFLPALVFRGDPLYRRPAESPAGEEPAPAEVLPARAARDRGRAVRLQKTDGTVEELSMDQYLWGVVAAEMPASFQPEALKAQACAARTYTVRLQSSPGRHPGADVCGDSTCCQAYVERSAAEARWGLDAEEYAQKIEAAVLATDGLGVLYGGAPIQAVFFSSAAGETVDAVQVWGSAVDYLRSVDSPEGEEVPNYHTQAVLPAEQVRAAVLAACPAVGLSGDPGTWFGEPVRGGGGAVASIPVGGVTFTGGQIRTMFSLRSASFTVDWDGENFIFDVTGYGHGVGMSQYGANALAEEGKDFRDILTWYYTGAEVGALW